MIPRLQQSNHQQQIRPEEGKVGINKERKPLGEQIIRGSNKPSEQRAN